jgi:hypothetical protein
MKEKPFSSLHGKKGTSRKSIPPATGDFALPPPKPEYFEQDGLRKVKPYMSVLKQLPLSLSANPN